LPWPQVLTEATELECLMVGPSQYAATEDMAVYCGHVQAQQAPIDRGRSMGAIFMPRRQHLR
jgi:hypothetical protein